jgi:hypothetical protein
MHAIKASVNMKASMLPEELIPFKTLNGSIGDTLTPRCMCHSPSHSLPLGFCPCQVVCKTCGCAWNMTPFDDGIAVVYLRDSSKKVRLKYFKCSNIQCRNRRFYNGHGDGLIVLYKNEDGEKVIFTAYSMIIIAEDIYCNSMTISEQYTKVSDVLLLKFCTIVVLLLKFRMGIGGCCIYSYIIDDGYVSLLHIFMEKCF